MNQTQMKKIVLKILKSILITIAVYLSVLFLYETYLEYDYVRECLSEGKARDWCKETWRELRMME